MIVKYQKKLPGVETWEDVKSLDEINFEVLPYNKLDTLLADWTRILLDNLSDPTIKENLSLLKPSSRRLVDAFLTNRNLPDKVETEFVQVVQEALSGLMKVIFSTNHLCTALANSGSPLTPAEIRKRFDDYVTEQTKGKDPGKVRILLE